MLHEFSVKVTCKIRRPLSKAEARRVVETCIPWCLEPQAGDVHAAFRIEDEATVSFWDALIVATAARSGATRVLSEDLNPGQIISGVTVVNPERGMVDQTSASWNRIASWLNRMEALRAAA